MKQRGVIPARLTKIRFTFLGTEFSRLEKQFFHMSMLVRRHRASS